MANVTVEVFNTLAVDFVRSKDIKVILRGLRTASDYEYELQMALTNRSLWSEFDTVFLMTRVDFMYLSSSVVRQVAQMGGDVSKFVPPCVQEKLKKKFGHT